MVLDVTARDIAAGRPGDCTKCMFALALDRALLQKFGNTGGIASVSYPLSNARPGVYATFRTSCVDVWRAQLPPVADQAVIDFDAGRPVSPFRCELTFTSE